MEAYDIERWGTPLRYAVELIGTVAFALSGILAGMRKRMDVFGISVLGFLAAFGGGTLRDILLDRRPFFWVAEVSLLWLVLGLCAASLVLLRGERRRVSDKAIQVADALGLGLFVATGVQYALVAQMPLLVAVLMGVVTGVFGGVMRDIACNEMPTAFADHRPYAVCAFFGGWVYVAVQWLNAPAWLVLLASAGVTTGLRLLALRFDWRVPGWKN
ncbi:MAG: trimeric intracellular cation channel family protein [Burkholderiaceae bacterium]|nr:trimeric intracellular cation channel family protein [Ottowia sp.]